MKVDRGRPDPQTLTSLIARSPIALSGREAHASALPANFTAVDADILDWIAAECRRTRLDYSAT
jgi:hypothetical protein